MGYVGEMLSVRGKRRPGRKHLVVTKNLALRSDLTQHDALVLIGDVSEGLSVRAKVGHYVIGTARQAFHLGVTLLEPERRSRHPISCS